MSLFLFKFFSHLGCHTILSLDSLLKSRDITLPTKACIVKLMLWFFSSHVWMWDSNHKESWKPENWWFWIMVLEKTLEISLGSKEIKTLNPKWSQPWISIGRTNTEAPIFWLLDANSWLIGKDPDTGKVWWQEEKGVTEDDMVIWHHWTNGHEFDQTLGDSEGHRSLLPWGLRESDST